MAICDALATLPVVMTMRLIGRIYVRPRRIERDHSLESEVVDCVVVGAGVVGIAIARALAMAGREVIVVDAAEGLGAQQRSGPCRHLLPPGQPDGAAVRPGATEALCVLRRARCAGSQLRQTHR